MSSVDFAILISAIFLSQAASRSVNTLAGVVWMVMAMLALWKNLS